MFTIKSKQPEITIPTSKNYTYKLDNLHKELSILRKNKKCKP